MEAEIWAWRPGIGLSDWDLGLEAGFWAAAPKGTKSCRTQGESVRPSVRTSVRPYVRPPHPILRALSPLGPKSKQNSPNPSKMVLIWLENLNSGLNSIILAPWT